jgi:hypothetical protein
MLNDLLVGQPPDVHHLHRCLYAFGRGHPPERLRCPGALPNGSDDHILVVGNHDSVGPSLIRHRRARETDHPLEPIDPVASLRRRRVVEEAGGAELINDIKPTIQDRFDEPLDDSAIPLRHIATHESS